MTRRLEREVLLQVGNFYDQNQWSRRRILELAPGRTSLKDEIQFLRKQKLSLKKSNVLVSVKTKFHNTF